LPLGSLDGRHAPRADGFGPLAEAGHHLLWVEGGHGGQRRGCAAVRRLPQPHWLGGCRRVGPPGNVAPDLVSSRAGGPTHYNGTAVERARTVGPWGWNAKVRTGCDKEFS
jgi:hypothetical protein